MAADGKVVIDVILEDGKVVKGVANVDKKLGGLTGSGQKAAIGIGKIVTALGLVALASKAINTLTQSLDGAISRYDTLNQFPRVMQQIGFSAEDSNKAINKLSDGIQGLPTTLDDVASTAQRIAVLTGDLDGAVDTTLALNNAFISSGADSANASRGLDQYVQMLSKGSVDLESWRTLQETMGVALNDVAKSFGFAGASAQNNLYDALKEGNITFSDFNSKLIELSGGVDGFADRAQTASGGIATSWGNVKTAISKGVADMIGAIDQALGGTGSIQGIIDGTKTAVQNAFSWIVGAIPVVASAISSVKDAITPWIPAIQVVVDTVRDLIVDRLTMAIDIAKQIFAGFIAFWQENGQQIIQNAIIIFTGIYNTVSTAFEGIWSIIQDVLSSRIVPFIQGILTTIQQFWQENGAQIMQAVQNAFSFIQGIIEFVMPAIQLIIGVVWSAIQDIISGALNVIMGIVQVFTGIFTGDFSQLWEGIKKIFKGAIDLILGIFSLTFVGGIRKFLANLLKNGVQIVKNLWTSIVNIFKNLVSNATNIVSGLVSRLLGYFKNIFNGAKQNFTNMLNSVKNIFGNVRTAITNIWDKVMGFFKGIDLKNIGKDIIRGLINGIGSMASAVVDKVKSIANGITKGFKNILGINSPSRVFKELGVFTGEGLEIGLESMKTKVAKVSDSLAKAAIPSMGNRRYTAEELAFVSPKVRSDEKTKVKADQVLKMLFKLKGEFQ